MRASPALLRPVLIQMKHCPQGWDKRHTKVALEGSRGCRRRLRTSWRLVAVTTIEAPALRMNAVCIKGQR